MKTGPKIRRGKLLAIPRGILRQHDLAELTVLEGDVLEARERLKAKRDEIAAALFNGAVVEPGPLRAFIQRYEKVTKSGHSIRIKLIVR